jgi:hypothetical protein
MLILLKLSCGDEVLGNLTKEDPNSYVLENPLKVMYQLRGPSRGPVVYLHQLMPFADGGQVNFPKQHVIFSAQPRRGLNSYYTSVLEDLAEASSNIEEQLSELSDELNDGAIDSDKEAVLALIEKQLISNNSIH